MPYLDIWPMLPSGQVPHRTDSVNCSGMGYSIKKPSKGGEGLRIYFFEKTSGSF